MKLNNKQQLVLIGGGHSHAIALKEWGKKPLPQVELTLITDVLLTPYSGMLPGYIAGFYRFEETHINLQKLAHFAQAQLILTQAMGLDLDKKQVFCADHSPISFDILSIDIGSTPNRLTVSGASSYAIPAKPVPQLLQAWEDLLTRVRQSPTKSLSIAIVGGGAGGVELALNMQTRLKTILQNVVINHPENRITFHLFHRGNRLLESHSPWVSHKLEKILQERSIHLHLSETVQAIHPISQNSCQLRCKSGLTLDTNYIFWVTQASSPDWIKTSGLSTDSQGFISVNNTLQSLSHQFVFAAGDIATMLNAPHPKAGVFAVRQGKPLFRNWRNLLLNQPLKPYYPQKYYLGLIGTGDQSAIASWGNWGWQSSWLWHWKDHIDRSFMAQFTTLGDS
ncbi:MAG: FAD-dependent oxidoreductase [Snowella sp.]|nr:FAD-dependent oxidoreductase [Snowella sp.]